MHPPQVVATLLGQRQMSFGVPCLRSLLNACADSIRLRVHDDGSLTEGDLQTLRRELNAPEVVRRVVADERARAAIAGRPHCAAFRLANPLALKLVDLALWTEGNVMYCDADILFERRFEGVFREPVERALFMRDAQDAYSVRPSHFLSGRGLRLARRLNSGIIVAPRALLDLDRVERFLALPDLRPSVWVEQTCWAMLAAGRCDVLDDRQFAIPRSAAVQATSETVALHFVSPVRSLLMKRLMDGGPPAEPVVPVRRLEAGTGGLGRLLASLVNRRLGRTSRA